MSGAPRTLALVLGDQLDADSALLRKLDPRRDAVWMAEVDRELTYVWSHKRRIAAFLSAMRHHRDALRDAGWSVHYTELAPDPAADRGASFADVLRLDVERLRPARLAVLHPGDHRVLAELEGTARELRLPLDVVPDDHFYLSLDDFERWARGRRELVLENFYRWMRRRFDVLIDGDEPETGRWNYDADNRGSFGASGPGAVPPLRAPRDDETTRQVLALVDARYSAHPGELGAPLGIPVTRPQALRALRRFVAERLPRFGATQDAMWTDQPFLHHSRLSFALNVRLLRPRECVDAAVAAYRRGAADIAAVEGYVRQILGWREFVRGVYWHFMPEYADHNALDCEPDRDVPRFYWDGETDMACVRDAMKGVLRHGYAHHIHRLMVLGLFAQLIGVHPLRFHRWHMAMYLDAIDWVSLPNALGMSQYGDGGIVGTKPYCASGAYIDRMSPYCAGCRYAPKRATGADACPFTTLYWDFLDRHYARFAKNARMRMQLRNLDRKSSADRATIRSRADWVRTRAARGERL